MARAAPVMNADSSLRRKSTKDAISAGLETRPVGLGAGPGSAPSGGAQQIPVQRSVNVARDQRVDLHAAARGLQRGRAGEADDPVLGGHVRGHAGYAPRVSGHAGPPTPAASAV